MPPFENLDLGLQYLYQRARAKERRLTGIFSSYMRFDMMLVAPIIADKGL